jgi:hypothetical protein
MIKREENIPARPRLASAEKKILASMFILLTRASIEYRDGFV